jgi:hypothetical protein
VEVEVEVVVLLEEEEVVGAEVEALSLAEQHHDHRSLERHHTHVVEVLDRGTLHVDNAFA